MKVKRKKTYQLYCVIFRGFSLVYLINGYDSTLQAYTFRKLKKMHGKRSPRYKDLNKIFTIFTIVF